MEFGEHHHEHQSHEQKELTKALTELVKAGTAFIKEATHALKDFEASQKPKGHAIFRAGEITPKIQPRK
jgi:hypothetical protein